MDTDSCPIRVRSEHFSQLLKCKEQSELKGLKNRATGQSTNPKQHQSRQSGIFWFSCCKYPRRDLISNNSTILAGRGPGEDIGPRWEVFPPHRCDAVNSENRHGTKCSGGWGSDALLSIPSLCFECHHLFSCRRTELSFNAGSL